MLPTIPFGIMFGMPLYIRLPFADLLQCSCHFFNRRRVANILVSKSSKFCVFVMSSTSFATGSIGIVMPPFRAALLQVLRKGAITSIFRGCVSICLYLYGTKRPLHICARYERNNKFNTWF